MLKSYTSLTILIFFLAFTGNLWSKPTWHVKDAEFRMVLQENWSKRNTVLVRLPAEFSDWKHVAVYNAAGQQVGCRPVILNGTMIAVEVSLSSSQMGKLQKSLYLYPTSSAAPVANHIGQPVSCLYTAESFVARPADCGEMTQYLKTHDPVKFYRTLPSFPVKTYGLHLFYKIQQTSDKRRSNNFRSLKIRAQLTTNLVTEFPQDVEFAIDNHDAGPWYLFLNNKPVFSWGNNTIVEDGKDVRSISVKTKAGLNRIDLFTFPDKIEMFPMLTYRLKGEDEFAKLPQDKLFSANEINYYRVEHRDKGRLCQFKLGRKFGRYYRESGKFAFPFSLKNLIGDEKPSASFSFKDKNVVFTEDTAEIVMDKSEAPLVVAVSDSQPVKQLTFHLRPDYYKLKETIVKFRLTEMPLFEPIEDDLVIGYKVEVNHGKTPLHTDAEVLVTYYAADGRSLKAQVMPVPASPFKRTLTVDRSLADMAYVDMALRVDGIVISNTVRTYLVPPQNVLGFSPKGGRFLHYKDGFAVLKRQRGQISVEQPKQDGPSQNAVFVDSFVANVEHPFDPVPVIENLIKNTKLMHLPFNPKKGDQSAIHAFICLIDRAMAEKADTIIIAPPFDVVKTLDFRDQRELIIFLSKSICAAGKRVVFVSYPYEGRLPRKELRDFALMLKEVGRSFSIPVVDLYSASLRIGGVAKYWEEAQPDGTTIHTVVPNEEGQRWILSEISDLLERKK
jgi:hypothetical protein